MRQLDGAVSFALLERRASRGDAFALGSIALYMLRTTRLPSGEPDPRAVALVAEAAAVGCNRCSRVLALGLGPTLLSNDASALDKLWRLHRRNERRRKQRVEAAAVSLPAAAVVTLTR